MKKIVVTLFILLQVSYIFSQRNLIAPHYMTEDELSRIDEIGKDFIATAPPEGEVRNIAEWEPMEGVLIAYTDWGFALPISLIKEMAEDCVVTTIVDNNAEKNEVISTFTNNSVNLLNCNFLISPITYEWTRDYSPWYIAVDNSEVAIVDFPYNRPARVAEDTIPHRMSVFLNENYYAMNVVHTGGNYMTDGFGQAASTTIVYTESAAEGITQTQVDERMEDYLGITNYHVMNDPLGDYIQHVDCWGKYLDVDKVLIGQVPSSDYRYDDYEATANYFANNDCSYGYPYQVFRVYSPGNVTPYTNSLILNDKVFVPQTGSQWDDEAIAVYESAMPGYTIIGVDYSDWYDTDALHCRTYGIADREMLFVKHYPLYDYVESNNGYLVEAEVYSYAGNSFAEGYPKVFYSVNDGVYQQIEMTEISANVFNAVIPEQVFETKIEYYIEVQDNEFKTVFNPLIGIEDPHVFYADGEIVNSCEKVQNELINIYPNPCSNYLFLDLKLTDNYNVAIYNISGTKVIEKTIENENYLKVDLTNLSQGIYTIRIESKNELNNISKMITKF